MHGAGAAIEPEDSTGIGARAGSRTPGADPPPTVQVRRLLL
jgi:hypothetical protein